MEKQADTGIFNMQESINNLLKNWWKIVLFTVIFSLLGFGFSFLKPPKYEAEAIFSSTIDYREINFENLVDERQQPLEFTQYEVDLALSAVQRSLLKTRNEALDYAQSLDSTLDADRFEHDTLIERLHDRWYLRFRHENPKIAQDVVNRWVELGLEQLARDQMDELTEPYVMVDLVAEAALPSTPQYQNRNTLSLAGAVIGFMIGVWTIDFKRENSPLQKTRDH
jgi:uncharacterized protein involved in exopolysaccharide biosynthesis